MAATESLAEFEFELHVTVAALETGAQSGQDPVSECGCPLTKTLPVGSGVYYVVRYLPASHAQRPASVTTKSVIHEAATESPLVVHVTATA